jgi:protein involved in polysaccharide export with SLBB domain
MRSIKKLFVGLALSTGMATWGLAAQHAGNQANSGPTAPAARQSEETSKDDMRGGGSPSFQSRRPRYRLAPEDVLDVNFPFSPEFNQTVTIQPDGYITLRDLGDFYAQGKTSTELAEGLREAYGKTLHDPVVTVDLKNFQRPYFIAGGEVGHPGKFDLREDTTVAQAVAIAGGFTDRSKHSQVLLFRRVSDNNVEVKKLNLKKMLYSANLQEDVYLRPGDMLYVPTNKITKIARFLPKEALGLYFRPLP